MIYPWWIGVKNEGGFILNESLSRTEKDCRDWLDAHNYTGDDQAEPRQCVVKIKPQKVSNVRKIRRE